MGSNNLLNLERWVDESYVINEVMRVRTGGCVSCGVGVIHSKASKTNLNTKITTESEVVAVNEYVPNKIHMINIILGQGYTLHKEVLYQDNESANNTDKNGRNSCTGNSRHISVGCFLLRIVWMRRSLVSSTTTHRLCLPTS